MRKIILNVIVGLLGSMMVFACLFVSIFHGDSIVNTISFFIGLAMTLKGVISVTKHVVK